MGDCHKTLKKFDLAVSSYSKAIQLVKKPFTSVDYKLNRAVCFFKLGQDQEALLDF
jgi:tetratricopeptide (TPR) repeat protein